MWDQELHRFEAVWMIKGVTHVYRKTFDDKQTAIQFLATKNDLIFKDVRSIVDYI